MNTYTAVAGDRLDLVCYRYYGHLIGSVERVLEANPGLGLAATALLPQGLVLSMPVVPEPGRFSPRFF